MHERGICARFLGRIATDSNMNHIRELAVIEILARCSKLLIKDGLAVLADTTFVKTGQNALN